MIDYNYQFMCPVEYPMFKDSSDIPINRYGVLFLIEKELMNGDKQFKDFCPESIFYILKDFLNQTDESKLRPLSNLLGIHPLEIENIFSELPEYSPNIDPLHNIVLSETLIYFYNELHELCQFVRDRIKNGKEFIFLDKEPEFAISFTPYPNFDDIFGEELAYGELH